MAQTNAPAPAPATPPPAAKTAPVVDAKAQAKPPELPGQPVHPEGADVKPAEAKKPINPIEAEVAEQMGEEWAQLSQKSKERLIAAEMKAREADKRMQISAKIQKEMQLTQQQTQTLINALKKDPWGVLSNPALGHDVRKLAEEYVWSMIQEQRMTPEQREAMQNKAELASLRAQKEQDKKDQEEREMTELTSKRRAFWEKTISEAIETEKLPKTSYTVRRFTEYIKAAAKNRIPADMPTIANQIRQELMAIQQQYLMPARFNGESDEQYEERVLASAPNEYIKLLRKADLRKLRAKGLAPKPGPKPTNGTGPAPQSKKMSMSDWLNQRDQRLGRK